MIVTRIPSLALLTLTSLANAQAELPRAEELEGLHERWSAGLKRLGVPGMSVVVVRDGEIVHLDAFGVRDDQGRPVTTKSGFYIASITKTYVAMALMTLVQDGLVELDALVTKYLPRLRLADGTENVMTVQDLLSHRRGLNCGPVVFLDAYTGEITEDRYYHFLEQATPAGDTAYTNVHFTLVGRVIEAVAKQKWQDFLAERVLKPAGMTRTTAYASELYGDRDAAIPMLPGPDGPIPAMVRKNDATMHAAGGMGTCAEDFGRYLLLNLGLGSIGETTVLEPDHAMAMQELQSNLQQPRQLGSGIAYDGFGLGWMIGEYRGSKILGHGGGYVGSSAYVMFLPEYDLGVGVLANTSGVATEAGITLCTEIIDALVPFDGRSGLPSLLKRARASRARNASAAPEPAAIELSLPVDRYVGRYTNAHWGTARLEVTDGRLGGRIGTMPIRFFPSERDRVIVAQGASAPSDPATFVVENDRVTGIEMSIFGEAVRFERDR